MCRSWSEASSRREDAAALKSAGVAEVYTPKDFELNRIMADLVRIVENTAADSQRQVTAASASASALALTGLRR